MFTVTSVIEIARTPDEVYAFLIDPGNWPKWVEDLRRVDGPSPMKKGDTFIETAMFRTDERRCKGVVLEADPGRLFVMNITEILSGPDVRTLRRFELEARSASTRVNWTNEVAVGGLMRAMQPVMPGMFRTRMAAYLEALKKALEKT
jgi:hypothetical protein